MGKALITILYFLIPFYLFGQESQINNQYIFNPIAINPALAGSGDALSANLIYKDQWVGIEGSPKILTFSTHSPLRKQNMGLGLFVINNQIGVSNETNVIGNYSYKIRMRKGDLAMGIGGGFLLVNTAWTELQANDSYDDLLQTNSPTYLIPQVSLGAYFSTKIYQIGFSLPYMLSYAYNSLRDKYTVRNEISNYTYVASGTYAFDLQNEFKVVPSIMVKYQKESNLDFILSGRVIYRDKYSIGTAYDSEQEVFKGMLQVQVNKQFSFGYSADFGSSMLNQNNIDSHELMIRYDFKYTIRVQSPRTF
ncbi:PorP/SprF family type IX secretion system membrane protein [Labilibaculum sp.]|uniref:PorP/SprF family type IX secretion system membrane protein n=1 Tax=Labilibaculum sp. TaxID=2060723 RepID=UPI0035681AE3